MELIGIINLTPDSFSDGGKNLIAANAITSAEEMLGDGAAYIDVGAESTRPGAETITPELEWRRIEPFLKAVKNIPVSIDTRNASTAARALEYNNVKILNDVSGFNDPEMVKLVAKHDTIIIVMHSLTVPADKNVVMTTPAVPALKSWISEKFKILTSAGIKPGKIIFDVGLGFGKTPQQSIELVQGAAELASHCHGLGTRILYGHSRKGFLGLFTDKPAQERDNETAQITTLLAKAKVDFARVHAIKPNKIALNIGDALS